MFCHLRDIIEQVRTSNPLDNALAYACMYTKQIQELLVYVSDTCSSSLLKSEKLVAITPMNKAKKVTFAKTATLQSLHSSSNSFISPLMSLNCESILVVNASIFSMSLELSLPSAKAMVFLREKDSSGIKESLCSIIKSMVEDLDDGSSG
ncbi:hypothetical protein Tco_1050826 [Tanacetum coccineum]